MRDPRLRSARRVCREGPPQDTAAEVARLQAEVREQRQLIMQLVRVEQEHYDLLLKLIQGRASASDLPAPAPAVIDPIDGDAAGVRALRRGQARRARACCAGRWPSPAAPSRTFTFTSTTSRARRRTATPSRSLSATNNAVSQVAVVQRGKKVVFPNYDSVFHIVFSTTARHPFDLGSYRAGDAPKSVELTATGVVDVFCNMHSRMHASVLVVPSPLFGRVAPDGSFELDGVPLGARKIVVWGPRSKPAERTVDVGAGGADVSFTLEVQPEVAHNNKLGQPYGSYKD